jgi:WD repeat-containing protein 42A
MRGDENGIVNVLEPHPVYPVLATSGLDYDVKIWISSNGEFTLDKDVLRKCVNENMVNQYETEISATFSINPALIELARRFFRRDRDNFGQDFDLSDTTDSD